MRWFCRSLEKRATPAKIVASGDPPKQIEDKLLDVQAEKHAQLVLILSDAQKKQGSMDKCVYDIAPNAMTPNSTS